LNRWWCEGWETAEKQERSCFGLRAKCHDGVWEMSGCVMSSFKLFQWFLFLCLCSSIFQCPWMGSRHSDFLPSSRTQSVIRMCL
jgi:hypothetical protein